MWDWYLAWAGEHWIVANSVEYQTRVSVLDFHRSVYLCLIALLSYLVAVVALSGTKVSHISKELAVRLPLAAQVMLAGGDRYLAANMLGVRVLVVETFRMAPYEFDIQAQLQQDVSWLNPAHEDNYYIAAAILAEPRLVPAAQGILRRAADARPNDWSPLFYYGFNRYHFEKNPAAGAAALLEAVPRARDQQDRWALENLAAKWIERGYRSAEAARLVDGMAKSSPAGGFRRYLEMRAKRLRDLDQLKNIAAEYRSRFGRKLERIDDLVAAGMIERIPADPLRVGYALDGAGEPVFGGPVTASRKPVSDKEK